MGNHVLHVPRLDDKTVLTAFRKLEVELSALSATSKLVTFDNQRLSPETEDIVAQTAGYFLRFAKLVIGSYSWTYNRHTAGQSDSPDPRFDSLTFAFPDTPELPHVAVVQTHAAVLSALGEPLLRSANPEDVERAIEPHRIILSKLENAYSDLLVSASKRRDDLEEQLHLRSEAMREQMANERTQLLEELQKQRELLTDRERDLEERKKILDDRDNTVVRREISRVLGKAVDERLQTLQPTQHTKSLRKIVHVVALLLLVSVSLAAFFNGALMSELLRASGTVSASVAVVAVKALGLTALAAALATWYLSWNNKWFQDHANSEMKLQQFKLDMARASWLVETAFEWRKGDKPDIPTALFGNLSSGLFSAVGEPHNDMKSPAEQVSSMLFGAASSAKFKIGDREVVVDRKA